MKKITKLLGFGLCSVLTFGFIAGCASMGVLLKGSAYFEGKNEADLVKYFKYDGSPVEADGDYDKVLSFSNLVITMYADKTTTEKFKNKRSQEIAKLEFYTLSEGCQYWTEMTNFRYFNIDLTRKSYSHYNIGNNNAQIKQGINNFYAIVQNLNAIENTISNQEKIRQTVNNTAIGKSFYLWEIRSFKFDQYVDNYHSESKGNAADYSIIKVDVYEDSRSSTETHIAYIYNNRENKYTDEKGNQITSADAFANEKSYIAKGFTSRKKAKGVSLIAYIKDGVVVKTKSVE